MKFLVNSISSYSAKSSMLKMNFIIPGSRLDGIEIYACAPKTAVDDIKIGEENEISQFICKSIWGWLWKTNAKLVKEAYKNKAPAGHKLEWGQEAENDFNEASKLNVQTIEQEKGNFVGKVGDHIYIILNKSKMVFSRNGVVDYRWVQNGYGWTHPTYEMCRWEFKDEAGNIFMYDCYSEKGNELIDNNSKIMFTDVVITDHNVFAGTRQTWIKMDNYKNMAPITEEQEYADSMVSITSGMMNILDDIDSLDDRIQFSQTEYGKKLVELIDKYNDSFIKPGKKYDMNIKGKKVEVEPIGAFYEGNEELLILKKDGSENKLLIPFKNRCSLLISKEG